MADPRIPPEVHWLLLSARAILRGGRDGFAAPERGAPAIGPCVVLMADRTEVDAWVAQTELALGIPAPRREATLVVIGGNTLVGVGRPPPDLHLLEDEDREP